MFDKHYKFVEEFLDNYKDTDFSVCFMSAGSCKLEHGFLKCLEQNGMVPKQIFVVDCLYFRSNFSELTSEAMDNMQEYADRCTFLDNVTLVPDSCKFAVGIRYSLAGSPYDLEFQKEKIRMTQFGYFLECQDIYD